MIREEVSGAPKRVWLHVSDGDDCWCAYHFEEDGDAARDRTLVAFVREQTWQPIETAPKDGTRILVWSDEKKAVLSVYWDKEFEYVYSEDVDQPQYNGAWTDNAVLSFGDEETCSYRPTWWMVAPSQAASPTGDAP